MRIDDFGRNPYDNIDRSKAATPNTNANNKTPGTKSSGSSTSAAGSTSPTNMTRADKLAQLKQAVQSNKPVDLQKLADALTETGIFFDEKA